MKPKPKYRDGELVLVKGSEAIGKAIVVDTDPIRYREHNERVIQVEFVRSKSVIDIYEKNAKPVLRFSERKVMQPELESEPERLPERLVDHFTYISLGAGMFSEFRRDHINSEDRDLSTDSESEN